MVSWNWNFHKNFMNFTFCFPALYESHLVCMDLRAFAKFMNFTAFLLIPELTSWKSLRRSIFRQFSRVPSSVLWYLLLRVVALFIVRFGFGLLSVQFHSLRGRLSSTPWSADVMWSSLQKKVMDTHLRMNRRYHHQHTFIPQAQRNKKKLSKSKSGQSIWIHTCMICTCVNVFMSAVYVYVCKAYMHCMFLVELKQKQVH